MGESPSTSHTPGEPQFHWLILLIFSHPHNLAADRLPLLLGVVESVVPGKDGLVRRVRIKTTHGSEERDICKVCLLEGVRDTLD